MTSQQFQKARGGLIWNLVQWIRLRQSALREGNFFQVQYAQLWIDDCRARVQRLNAMQRQKSVISGAVTSNQYSEESA